MNKLIGVSIGDIDGIGIDEKAFWIGNGLLFLFPKKWTEKHLQQSRLCLSTKRARPKTKRTTKRI